MSQNLQYQREWKILPTDGVVSTGTATVNLASVAAGTYYTLAAITGVTGADVAKKNIVQFTLPTEFLNSGLRYVGAECDGTVNQAQITVYNPTTAAIDVASGTWTWRVYDKSN
jgi:hypothetical protein